jgi:MFS family permease
MSNIKTTEQQAPGKNYKWIALSNTTLGMLMASLNGSTTMIALPAIFRGINLDPLDPANSTYLLCILMGYPLVMAVLLVTVGRIGDMFGRVRMYNLGFVIFSIGSILLSLTWSTGPAGAIELILFRLVQAVGGALLIANSAAILTDAFPADQRGMALGINMVTFNAGAFIGLLVGGLLAEAHWRWVFLVNVPIGMFGTIWAYLMLRELGVHKAEKVDWIGNGTFAIGLTMILISMIYGVTPYGDSVMGWGSPFVLGMVFGGLALLALFVAWEGRASAPMFRLALFRIRAFTAANIAGFLQALARGGLVIMLSVWLQGIWLPLHGYDFKVTPLWAGICILPETATIMIVGPTSGYLSDRFGARFFSTGGMILEAIALALLMTLPVDFSYLHFALILVCSGAGLGFFASPNVAAIMNSVPAKDRGAASGMRATLQNLGMPLSQGMYFTLMIIGLNASVPHAIFNGLTQHGVALAVATKLSQIPPFSYLFAALLGYNPLGTLLGPQVLNSLNPTAAAALTSRSYFPQLISGAFGHGLKIVMGFSVVMCLISAAASWLRGGKYVYSDEE